MITDKDIEVLYYKTPMKYRGRLDGEIDPNRMDNFDKEHALGEKLLQCSKTEFIETMIKVFKNKYANAGKIRVHIINYDWKTELVSPKRKDFKQLVFDFKEEVKNDHGGPDEYLDSLLVEFDTTVPLIENNVKKALLGKQFATTQQGDKTTFTIEKSPITRIEISDKTFQMFIDKKSFIDYDTW